MSEKLTAAVVEEFGPTLTIREEDLPEPGRFRALVKNVASGICHTDVHAAGGRDWPVKPPAALHSRPRRCRRSGQAGPR